MTDQIDLQADLDECRELLFATHDLITPEHVDAIKERVTKLMSAKKWVLTTDDVDVELHDETEFVDVSVRVGRASAFLPLRWEMADGSFAVRVDTDSDGQ